MVHLASRIRLLTNHEIIFVSLTRISQIHHKCQTSSISHQASLQPIHYLGRHELHKLVRKLTNSNILF